MSDSTKRTIRTGYQLLLALITGVPVIIFALPPDLQAQDIVVGFAAWVAIVARVVNALEDAGLIPAWFKTTTFNDVVDEDDPVGPAAAVGFAQVPLSSPGLTMHLRCPVATCRQTFDIAMTGETWGSVPPTDSGCALVTRTRSPELDEHIQSHWADGTYAPALLEHTETHAAAYTRQAEQLRDRIREYSPD